MFSSIFPPLPPWEGMHPLVVHFPIVLLMLSPVFLAMGFAPKTGRVWATAALGVLILGTAAAFVAISTGDATEERVTGASATAVLHQHQRLADRTRTIYMLLTLAYAGFYFIAPMFKKTPPLVINTLRAVFVGVALGGTVFVANTAHLGGRLVHDFGVTAEFGGGGDGDESADEVDADGDDSDE